MTSPRGWRAHSRLLAEDYDFTSWLESSYQSFLSRIMTLPRGWRARTKASCQGLWPYLVVEELVPQLFVDDYDLTSWLESSYQSCLPRIMTFPRGWRARIKASCRGLWPYLVVGELVPKLLVEDCDLTSWLESSYQSFLSRIVTLPRGWRARNKASCRRLWPFLVVGEFVPKLLVEDYDLTSWLESSYQSFLSRIVTFPRGWRARTKASCRGLWPYLVVGELVSKLLIEDCDLTSWLESSYQSFLSRIVTLPRGWRARIKASYRGLWPYLVVGELVPKLLVEDCDLTSWLERSYQSFLSRIVTLPRGWRARTKASCRGLWPYLVVGELIPKLLVEDCDLSSWLESSYQSFLSRIMTLPRGWRARIKASYRGLWPFLVVGELVPKLLVGDCDLTSWLESSYQSFLSRIVTLPRGWRACIKASYRGLWPYLVVGELVSKLLIEDCDLTSWLESSYQSFLSRIVTLPRGWSARTKASCRGLWPYLVVGELVPKLLVKDCDLTSWLESSYQSFLSRIVTLPRGWRARTKASCRGLWPYLVVGELVSKLLIEDCDLTSWLESSYQSFLSRIVTLPRGWRARTKASCRRLWPFLVVGEFVPKLLVEDYDLTSWLESSYQSFLSRIVTFPRGWRARTKASCRGLWPYLVVGELVSKLLIEDCDLTSWLESSYQSFLSRIVTLPRGWRARIKASYRGLWPYLVVGELVPKLLVEDCDLTSWLERSYQSFLSRIVTLPRGWRARTKASCRGLWPYLVVGELVPKLLVEDCDLTSWLESSYQSFLSRIVTLPRGWRARIKASCRGLWPYLVVGELVPKLLVEDCDLTSWLESSYQSFLSKIVTFPRGWRARTKASCRGLWPYLVVGELVSKLLIEDCDLSSWLESSHQSFLSGIVTLPRGWRARIKASYRGLWPYLVVGELVPKLLVEDCDLTSWLERSYQSFLSRIVTLPRGWRARTKASCRGLWPYLVVGELVPKLLVEDCDLTSWLESSYQSFLSRIVTLPRGWSARTKASCRGLWPYLSWLESSYQSFLSRIVTLPRGWRARTKASCRGLWPYLVVGELVPKLLVEDCDLTSWLESSYQSFLSKIVTFPRGWRVRTKASCRGLWPYLVVGELVSKLLIEDCDLSSWLESSYQSFLSGIVTLPRGWRARTKASYRGLWPYLVVGELVPKLLVKDCDLTSWLESSYQSFLSRIVTLPRGWRARTKASFRGLWPYLVVGELVPKLLVEDCDLTSWLESSYQSFLSRIVTLPRGWRARTKASCRGLWPYLVVGELVPKLLVEDCDLSSWLESSYQSFLSRIMTIPRGWRARIKASYRGLWPFLVVGELVPKLLVGDCDLTSWLESSYQSFLSRIVTLPRGWRARIKASYRGLWPYLMVGELVSKLLIEDCDLTSWLESSYQSFLSRIVTLPRGWRARTKASCRGLWPYLVVGELVPKLLVEDCDLTSWLESSYQSFLSRIVTLPRGWRAHTKASCRGLWPYLVVGELVPKLPFEDCDLTSWLESSYQSFLSRIVTLPRGWRARTKASFRGLWPYLVVGELVPRLLAVAEDLPQHDAVAPHVRLDSEGPVQDALWRHPADRQHGRVTSHLRQDGQLGRAAWSCDLPPTTRRTIRAGSMVVWPPTYGKTDN